MAICVECDDEESGFCCNGTCRRVQCPVCYSCDAEAGRGRKLIKGYCVPCLAELAEGFAKGSRPSSY